MTKQKSKLDKVNVPELFVQRFVYEDNRSGTILTNKLRKATPTNRGRGLTRVIENLTPGEWEELYQLAAHGRSQMIGADRETTLRPAICARALAERMEKLGVDNPITYTPKRKRTTPTPAPVNTVPDDDDDDTDLSSTVTVPNTPPTVNRANDDVNEVDDDELDDFNDDLAIGN